VGRDPDLKVPVPEGKSGVTGMQVLMMEEWRIQKGRVSGLHAPVQGRPPLTPPKPPADPKKQTPPTLQEKNNPQPSQTRTQNQRTSCIPRPRTPPPSKKKKKTFLHPQTKDQAKNTTRPEDLTTPSKKQKNSSPTPHQTTHPLFQQDRNSHLLKNKTTIAPPTKEGTTTKKHRKLKGQKIKELARLPH